MSIGHTIPREHSSVRAALAQDIARYLEAGGTIEQVPAGVSGEDLSVRRRGDGNTGWANPTGRPTTDIARKRI